MTSKARKTAIGLITLGLLILLFWMYRHFSDTEPIQISQTPIDEVNTVPDANAAMGQVDEKTQIGTFQDANFITYDTQGNIHQKFGFKRLHYQSDNEWQVDDPFMEMYQHDNRIRIDAQVGRFLTEQDAKAFSPKQAAFSGNVKIVISPISPNSTDQVAIYLDTIDYIAERSQFFTDGSVRLESEQVQMQGRGLDLVYHELENRLEYMRVRALDSLVYTNPTNQASIFNSESVTVEKRQPDQREDVKLHDSNKDRNNYRLIFDDHVRIYTADQLITTERLDITNIGSKEPPASDESKEQNTQPQQISDNRKNGELSSIQTVKLNCDGGLLLVPMETADFEKYLTKPKLPTLQEETHTVGRPNTVFDCKQIEYDFGRVADRRIAAQGPLTLEFIVEDFLDNKANNAPARLTAQQKAIIYTDRRNAVLTGDCSCKLDVADDEVIEQYSLKGDEFLIDFSPQTPNQDSSTSLKHFTAKDGPVKLSSVKTKNGEFVSGVQLKAAQIDYDGLAQQFSAVGPGMITLNHSKIPEPNEKLSKFSFERPCWATIEDFNSLQYNFVQNNITASGNTRQVRFNYLPIENGQYGQAVHASAGMINAQLHTTESDRIELEYLFAGKGVSFNEKRNGRNQKDIEFLGSQFTFDVNSGLITATGSKNHPCLFNGALVGQIEYNVNTEKLKVKEISGGAIQ